MGAAEPAITIVAASIPALRVLLTDFKHFTERRFSDQSESQGSNFDFWDDNSRKSRRSFFKWDIFGSSKSVEPSNATGTASTVTCSDTTTLAPPAGLAATFWTSHSEDRRPKSDCESLGGRRANLTPDASSSVPMPARPAPSHNYPNLSQQLEDFLWSRKNSYADTLSESIYDGGHNPVLNTISKNPNKAGAIEQCFLGAKPQYTGGLKVAKDNDRAPWYLSNVMEGGEGGKRSAVLHRGAHGHVVVVQTTEVTVEFE